MALSRKSCEGRYVRCSSRSASIAPVAGFFVDGFFAAMDRVPEVAANAGAPRNALGRRGAEYTEPPSGETRREGWGDRFFESWIAGEYQLERVGWSARRPRGLRADGAVLPRDGPNRLLDVGQERRAIGRLRQAHPRGETQRRRLVSLGLGHSPDVGLEILGEREQESKAHRIAGAPGPADAADETGREPEGARRRAVIPLRDRAHAPLIHLFDRSRPLEDLHVVVDFLRGLSERFRQLRARARLVGALQELEPERVQERSRLVRLFDQHHFPHRDILRIPE